MMEEFISRRDAETQRTMPVALASCGDYMV